MLLTLSAKSFWSGAKRGKQPSVELCDLPRLAQTELGLMGLTIHTSMLTGWEQRDLDRLRDSGDKASCPCLLLVEDQPQSLDAKPDAYAVVQDRFERVLRVAHRLGCAGIAVPLEAPAMDEIPEVIAQRLKNLVTKAERLELNLLLAPTPGLTETPERLTTLIRRVGGFRIGSYPDFAAAARTEAMGPYLRALAPYASVISASCLDFDAKGRHSSFDLVECVTAVREVGYDASMTLEFRGKGDPIAALAQSKAIIEQSLGIAAVVEPGEAGDDEEEADE